MKSKWRSFLQSCDPCDRSQQPVGIDIRIPVLADKEALVARLREIAASYQLEYEEFDYLAPLYVPLDSLL